ncbi:MAG: amidohydrolase family protein [Atopobiaceae bacterium]|nr:amidohydrolase family protein [Atopobiaceae bacterium]
MGRYAFVNGYVLDGTLDESGVMVAHEGWAVLVDGERIEAAGELSTADLAGHEIVDLAGAYVMPGLVNLHAHLAASGKPPRKNAKPVNYKRLFDTLSRVPPVLAGYRALCASMARTQLLSGVTTLRCVGGILDFDGQIRDRVDAGRAQGPRMLVCNTGVSVPGGHFAGSLATEASSPEEAAEHVRQIAATNPDWIKLMITGGVMDASEEGEPGVLRMPPELVRAACDQAHKLGYRVCAHVESPEGVRVALENGVDTIEHGAQPDERIIELFRERGVADVCTISPALPYALFPLEESHVPALAKANGKVVMDGIIACARACLAAGIPVGLGTDSGCPFITHYDMWRELVYFVRYCDVTPDFALHTATAVNASILGLSEQVGTLEAGKSADLVVCAANPLEDLSRLRSLELVMCRGRLVRHPRPRKMAAVERALDRYL